VVDHHTLDDFRHVEPFAVRIVVESLTAKGIRFRTECGVASTAMVDGQVVVTLDNGDQVTAELTGLAAGRTRASPVSLTRENNIRWCDTNAGALSLVSPDAGLSSERC
jgi:pyruvate/2-oxoglutarate dehydrogenase complex dihydrolipoamide dehydrogenase (E3) component